MKNFFNHIFIALFLIAVLLVPYFVFATPLDNLQSVAKEGGYSNEVSETTFATTTGTLVSVFLGFLGIIFIVLMIWSGYNWMTAGGNEEKLSKAKSTIYRAIIGLAITLSAYAIWRYIYFKIIF